VHVATFADDDFDTGEESDLAALARSHILVRRSRPIAVSGLKALAANQPVSLTAFDDRRLRSYVENVLATRPIGAIYVFSGQMAQYVPDGFAGRVIADFVDVDSAKFEAYAQRHGGPMAWIEAREGRLLRAEEARIAARADVSLLITEAEVRLFRERLPEDARNETDVRALGNGISSGVFDPALVGPETRMRDCGSPRLIFTGQMDYSPNVDAVVRVARQILPMIREILPDATFHIVGRNPVRDVHDLASVPGCHVWGRVDDIRTWLKAADIALVPLDIARGVQNKVLEAMAMALPVVLTSGAAQGIDAAHGEHFHIADSDEDLASAVIGLAHDARRAVTMGTAARKYVIDKVSWRSQLAGLSEIVGLRPKTVRDAA
jgi:sugar transferase (PEP-CTERM/EpsH1 system associated)